MHYTDHTQNSWRAYRSLKVKRRAGRLALRKAVRQAVTLTTAAALATLAGWYAVAPALMAWGV